MSLGNARIVRFAGILLSLHIGTVSADKLSAWTPADSVAVRYFKSPYGLGSDLFTSPSADGKRFFAITTYGDLAADKIVDELHIFSTADVLKAVERGKRIAPRPIRTVRLESSYGDAQNAPISEIKWENNDTLLVSGARATADLGIYRLNVSDGSVTRLTSADHTAFTGLAQFGTAGNSVVYMAQDRSAPVVPPRLTQYPFAKVTGPAVQELLYSLYPWNRGALQLFASVGPGQKPQSIPFETESVLRRVWMSKDGRKAVVVIAPRDLKAPASWSAYEGNYRRFWYRFVLLDLEKGTSEPMLDAPVGDAATRIGSISSARIDALWSDDAEHVVLVNAALPLSEDSEVRRTMPYIVDYSVADRRWKVLEPFKTADGEVSAVGWLDPGKQWLLTRKSVDGKPVAGRIYTLESNGWTARSVDSSIAFPSVDEPALPRGLEVSVRQGLNDPPRLVASFAGKTVDLLGGDPAVDGKWLAKVRKINWQEPGGKTIYGGLLLPRDYVAGSPIPLVINAYDFKPNEFQPDAPFANTAYAAQATAARGMAVLIMDIPWIVGNTQTLAKKPYIAHWKNWNDANDPQELKIFMGNLDAAVDSLVKAGIADPKRIGLVGFSRGGYLTLYAVTHPVKTKLAAAITADCVTGGLADLINMAVIAKDDDEAYDIAMPDVLRHHYKGTFWQNKQGWLKDSTLPNAESVQTPVLFSTAGVGEFPDMFETIAAWRLNRRPFEYLMFPNAGHEVYMPRERYELMRGTVEWMDFWLQGQAPKDAERASQWEKLKTDWNRQKAWESAGHPVGSKPEMPR